MGAGVTTLALQARADPDLQTVLKLEHTKPSDVSDLKGADLEQRNNAGFRPLDLTKSQLLRELLLKTVSRRPCWLICGREDDELHFGLRIRK